MTSIVLYSCTQEKKETSKYFEIVDIRPPAIQCMFILVITKKYFSGTFLLMKLQTCMHLKSSIHQKYKTTLDHVLAHNHHNSSELIRQHVQHYANSNHTISQYVSIMQSHHYTNFNREWQIVKQEIQILEQHLNKFTKTTWSHPELFDDVQFLSATLLQSAGMFQTFVQDVLKSMQYHYAKQWFVAFYSYQHTCIN